MRETCLEVVAVEKSPGNLIKREEDDDANAPDQLDRNGSPYRQLRRLLPEVVEAGNGEGWGEACVSSHQLWPGRARGNVA